MAALGAVPVLGAAAVAWALWAGRRGAVVGGLTATAVAFMGLACAFLAPPVESAKAPKALVTLAEACRPDEEVRVACLDYFQPSLVFYCRREVRRLEDEAQALDLLRRPMQVYLLCPAERWQELQAKSPASCRPVARRYDLYRNRDIVVVTNR
jgi:hypothetical protein